MSAPFYRAFEDRHRGSRELIKERLAVYLPFIERLIEIYPDCRIIDVGCGRGEWLELLGEHGVDARGIDQDLGMLEACQSLGLPAEQGDALEALRVLPDESVAAVTGFHIAEHIPFEQLRSLVEEALRVLKPAGLLILETPNAENMVVGTHTFYLDPTHERPIPQLLLSFLVEHAGFNRNKVLRLQEAPHLREAQEISLVQVLEGVSPDYAILAQKYDEEVRLAPFDYLFKREYGVSLKSLASRFDSYCDTRVRELKVSIREAETRVQDKVKALEVDRLWQLEQRLSKLEGKFSLKDDIHPLVQENLQVSREKQLIEFELKQAQQRCTNLESHLAQLQKRVQQAEQERNSNQQALEQTNAQLATARHKLDESLGNAHNWYLRACDAEAQLHAILNSRSWRVTWPLRMTGKGMRWALKLPLRLAKACIRPMVRVAMQFVLKRPTLRHRLNTQLQRFPRLYTRLRQFAHYYNLLGGSQAPVSALASSGMHLNKTSATENQEGQEGLANLTPRARVIYSQLKAAVESKENS
jgi:O-antigen chain-terminating methyltransferase